MTAVEQGCAARVSAQVVFQSSEFQALGIPSEVHQTEAGRKEMKDLSGKLSNEAP